MSTRFSSPILGVGGHEGPISELPAPDHPREQVYRHRFCDAINIRPGSGRYIWWNKRDARWYQAWRQLREASSLDNKTVASLTRWATDLSIVAICIVFVRGAKPYSVGFKDREKLCDFITRSRHPWMYRIIYLDGSQ